MLDYYERAYQRLNPYFETGGDYFLDVGCGGNPAERYSGKFEKHVCVDFAQAGLLEARAQLGEKGRYVVADMAHLPFKTNSFAGGVSANSLYHLPPDKQRLALREFVRTLNPRALFVILYISGYVLGLGKVLRSAWRTLTRYQPPTAIQQNPSLSTPPCWALMPHELRRETGPQGQVEVKSYRILHRHISSRLIPHNRVGEQLLALLMWLEEQFPRLFVFLGYYVSVIITKQ